jgi:hypothetical protein
MFNSSRNWETTGLKGLDGLGRELGLSLAKRMIGGCPRNYSVRHYSFKILQWTIKCCPRPSQGGWFAKALGIIRSCPSQASRPLEEGWPWDNSVLSWLKDQLRKLVPQGLLGRFWESGPWLVLS